MGTNPMVKEGQFHYPSHIIFKRNLHLKQSSLFHSYPQCIYPSKEHFTENSQNSIKLTSVQYRTGGPNVKESNAAFDANCLSNRNILNFDTRLLHNLTEKTKGRTEYIIMYNDIKIAINRNYMSYSYAKALNLCNGTELENLKNNFSLASATSSS